jgi:hypothetical protein
MRITVQAHHPSHSNLVRAGRFWPTGEPKEVEVIDSEADPPEIVTRVKNHTTQLMQDVKRPDPDRIGRRTLKILEDDKRLSLKQLDGLTSRAADAAVGAARQEVSRLSQELLDMKAKLAKAEEERNEALKARDVAQEELAKLAAEVQKQAEGEKSEGEGKDGKGKGAGKTSR